MELAWTHTEKEMMTALSYKQYIMRPQRKMAISELWKEI